MNANRPDQRSITSGGPNTVEILKVLEKDLGPAGIKSAIEKAAKIIELCVDPKAGPPPQDSDGLLYGLIQSGKTSIMTVAAGMAADNGFDCILVLTTDNDLLYEQTHDRLRAALRGLTVLGKRDWRDTARFARQLRMTPFSIVCSKNGNMLASLLHAFQNARAGGMSILIMDDEADQASLNTFTSAGTGRVSRINQVISDLRNYFPINTYLQVTATPQALFLQRPNHEYRPSFTVLSEPGRGYVGGDAFFGTGHRRLLRIVDLNEVIQLRASNQPTPSGTLPPGLRRALFTFLIGAATKMIERPHDGFAFLCHVSMATRDHAYTVMLIDGFKEQIINTFQKKDSTKYRALMKELRGAYDDLRSTEPNLPEFEVLVDKIEFYIKGANIKLINATSNEEIKLDAVFNLFIGGNKLGRGVTIKNLLVSYYGRNPRRPNADTVLQHARMYGYRYKDLGVTRLFLPQRLADHFSSIHEMETALRELLQSYPNGCFEGIFISGALQATRRNVIDPNSLGSYIAGHNYNPRYPLRTAGAAKATTWIDNELRNTSDAPPCRTTKIGRIVELMAHCQVDPAHGAQLWDLRAIKAALHIIEKRSGDRAYLVVKRNRDLAAVRTEKHGIIHSDEAGLAPRDAPVLFLYRTNANTRKGESEAWWPQLRFPAGNYVLAFSFDW